MAAYDREVSMHPAADTATVDFAGLYREAFARFVVRPLWSTRAVAEPSPADAMAITLRPHGGKEGRRLAARGGYRERS
jgi:hypothetical protein